MRGPQIIIRAAVRTWRRGWVVTIYKCDKRGRRCEEMAAWDDKLLIGLITFIGFCHRSPLHPETRNQDWELFRNEISLKDQFYIQGCVLQFNKEFLETAFWREILQLRVNFLPSSMTSTQVILFKKPLLPSMLRFWSLWVNACKNFNCFELICAINSGLSFPLSEVLSTRISSEYFQIFYLYLFSGSLIYLSFVYCDLLREK